MTPDPNRSLRYRYIKTKRSYRQAAKPHLLDLWVSAVDLTNSLARSILGLAVVLFETLTEVCKYWQTRWTTSPNSRRMPPEC